MKNSFSMKNIIRFTSVFIIFFSILTVIGFSEKENPQINFLKNLHGGKGILNNKKVIIPFTIKGTHLIFVDVKINNKGKESLIFDTGGQTMLDKSIIEKYKLDVKKINDKFSIVKLDTLNINGAMVNNYRAFIINFNKRFNLIGKNVGFELSGMIGCDLLRFFTVTINYQKKQLIISKSGNNISKRTNKDHLMDMEILFPYHPSIIIGLNDEFSVKGIIDTGFMYAIALSFDTLKEINKDGKLKLIKSKGSFALWPFSKIKYNYLAKFKKIIIGDIVLKNQPVIFADLPKFPDGDSALIGKNFLENYILSMDFNQNKIMLSENKKTDNSLLFSIGANITKEDNKKVFVKGIWENSPADKKGLEIGDIIIAINGISVKYIDNKKIYNLLTNKAIKELKLKIKKQNGDIIALIIKKKYLL